MNYFKLVRLFARFAIVGSLGMLTNASASPIADSNALLKRGGLRTEEPICNGVSSCVYLKNAVVTGTNVHTACRCRSVNAQGQGTDVCEFPMFSSVYIKCKNVPGNLTVTFGDGSSHYDRRGAISAQWSSQKRGQFSANGHYEDTNVTGDDLYVAC